VAAAEEATMSVQPQAIDPTLTIGEIVRRYPTTLAAFNAHGLDTCCGGALPLAEAAERHGLDLAGFLTALARAAEG
jgi:regulator of cell morphogenesis and NO signaling